MANGNNHEMYDRLLEEFSSLYQANQKRIHRGLWGMIVVLVLYLTLLFITQGEKVIILLLWIMTMFALAAYLVTIEYLNHELEKKIEHITMTEQNLGPSGADVIAESNIAKLRSMIAEKPSLVDAILHHLESENDHAAVPDAAAVVAAAAVTNSDAAVESGDNTEAPAEVSDDAEKLTGEPEEKAENAAEDAAVTAPIDLSEISDVKETPDAEAAEEPMQQEAVDEEPEKAEAEGTESAEAVAADNSTAASSSFDDLFDDDSDDDDDDVPKHSFDDIYSELMTDSASADKNGSASEVDE
jgi:Ca2+/Na+ antiporter